MCSHKELNWFNLVFMTLSPIFAFICVGISLHTQGLHNEDLLTFMLMLVLTGLSITAGYHRYYSHRSYECHMVVQLFYLLFGAAALQNSVLYWASDHRYHHRFVDQEKDPYNITKGIFWAHLSWIFSKEPPDRSFENIPDLTTNRLVMWQHRYYLPIGFGMCFIAPLLLGLAFGRLWNGLLWGGLLRVVVFHHITFLFLSFAHVTGSQPYSTKNSSRDNWWLAFLTFGDGYHNFHHTFQGDYRSSAAWYQWDPSKWWIWSLSQVRLTWRLNKTQSRLSR
jgi:stearoyl-CoA desaturase (delta-9 desaturase)